MTLDQQISAAIDKANQVLYAWSDKFLNEIKYGDAHCGELKLFVLGQWMLILKDYRIYNFEDGSAITPAYTCVTEVQILLLISKINALSC